MVVMGVKEDGGDVGVRRGGDVVNRAQRGGGGATASEGRLLV